MKTIRKKITVCLMATVLVALVAVGTTGITLNYRSTLMTVEQLMTQTAALAGERVEQELLAYRNVAMDTGRVSQLADPEVPVEEKRAIIDERVSLHGFQRGNVIGADGISIFDGKDYSDREYVQNALKGVAYVSEPLISKITGELSIMVAAPLYSDSGEIAGVVYFVPPETFLNDIVSSIRIGENCRAYMINKNGDTIADITLDTITTQNVEKEAASDPSLKSRAALHEAMRRGETGFGRIKERGGGVAGEQLSKRYILRHVHKRAGDRDIHTGLHSRGAEAFKQYQQPHAGMCKEDEASGGRRSGISPAPEVVGRDETAELTRSTGEMVQGLNTIIHDIDYLLNQMANQNFDIVSSNREAYVGDFKSILSSMRNLKVELRGPWSRPAPYSSWRPLSLRYQAAPSAPLWPPTRPASS